ncbi:hypothetical protein HHK36_023764 [Tetracentron sinense]|uniref:Uncharacterized protein n=1 Tax=Tetracentron sinense TaxID=13715 RepID=A0A835D8Z3_TETSI|nr:hypothetical protein HHK36_023764 [Tetracentron sinense]
MAVVFCSLLPSYSILDHSRLLWPQTRRKRSQTMTPHLSASLNSHEYLRVKDRRSAHYHSSIWDHRFIESLNSPYTYDRCTNQLEHLKREAKMIFKSTKETSILLRLIDSMQRLGVAYHFEDEIKEALDRVALEVPDDLYSTALWFRLLRQHAYQASSEVFNKFKNSSGGFMESLSQDHEGLLSLYEASHLGINGEDVLEEAKKFSVKHLKPLMGHLESDQADQVQHSLEIPSHWRTPRAEARNFIDVYERDDAKSLHLLELAKLDFNLVQSVYQSDLRELSRWWRDLGFVEKLSFSRDRLMENFLWAFGIISEPQFSKCRKGLTKFTCILTAIDDIYDIYGSLDELERFTDAVDRWDIKAMDKLPEYMKICYLALFNFANELAYDALKDHGMDIFPYIRKEWLNLCRSYMVEARWFYKGYTPTLDEYLRNAWTSVGGPAAMVHSYFLLGYTVNNGSSDCLKLGSELFYWSSLITRLSDDMGTSKAEMVRGDVAKSIQCHMNKAGVSEKQAREHIEGLVKDSWKKLNGECIKTSLPRPIVSMSLNMARTAQFIFEHGDGIGTSEGVTKDRVMSLFVEPIPIEGFDRTVMQQGITIF